MKEYHVVEGDTINLGELSKYNGLSEFENMKAILEILSVKAEVYDIPQRVSLEFPSNQEGGLNETT